LAAGNGVQVTRSKKYVWQDGAKRRCDELLEYLDGQGVTEVPPHRHVSIETPEYIVHWNGRPTPPPTKRCAHFELSSPKNLKQFEPMFPSDFRPVGLVQTWLLHSREYPWDAVIGTPDRIDPVTVAKNGEQVTVSFVKQMKSRLFVEQSYERRGEKYLLRRVAVRDENNKYRTTMQCNYPDALSAGFMLPNEIESTHARDDYVIYQEKSKVRIKSVNEPIPASPFSIASAGLPPGTPVIGDAIPPGLILQFHHVEWNGQALVPVPN